MTSRLLTGSGGVWPEITAAARAASRADVAVAYFGKGGARRLPLKAGSRLVVDADEATVKSGATCPAELLKLVRKRVEVYHRAHLHAKVFVFPRKTYIGSTNVSASSANALDEAVVCTTDASAVRKAREYVTSLLATRLGPDELMRLQEKYREPRVPGGRHTTRRPSAKAWFDFFEYADCPPGSEDDAAEAFGQAESEVAEDYIVEETWQSGPPRYNEGDTIIYVTDEGDGRLMVTPPARVTRIMGWSNGRARCTFTYAERPKRNRVELNRLAKALGHGWKTRLSRFGRLNRETASRLIAWWYR